MSTAALVRDCKVALEDITYCDVVKLKILNTNQGNTHTTSSHLTKVERLWVLECENTGRFGQSKGRVFGKTGWYCIQQTKKL